jgi:hypothetical protein
MIEFLLNDDHSTGMVARCDVCGETVTGSHANLLYPRVKTPGPLPYRIACKSFCTYVVDQKYGRQWWVCLDAAIATLVAAAGVDLDQAH